MAGGVVKTFGIGFMLLGGLAILVGLAAAGFGGYVANEEQQRGVFGDSEKAETGMLGVYGGLGIAAAGLVVLLLVGVPLTMWGNALARREMLQAMRERPAAEAPAVARAPETIPAPRARTGSVRGALFAGVGVAALLILGLLLLFEPGVAGEFRPLVAGAAETPVQVVEFDGHVRGGAAPVLGGVGGSIQTARPEHARGVLTGTLNWTEGPSSADALILILEAESATGEWVELARGEGGAGLQVEAPEATFPAGMRARVFVGGTGAADMDYHLTLTLRPVS